MYPIPFWKYRESIDEANGVSRLSQTYLRRVVVRERCFRHASEESIAHLRHVFVWTDTANPTQPFLGPQLSRQPMAEISPYVL